MSICWPLYTTRRVTCCTCKLPTITPWFACRALLASSCTIRSSSSRQSACRALAVCLYHQGICFTSAVVRRAKNNGTQSCKRHWSKQKPSGKSDAVQCFRLPSSSFLLPPRSTKPCCHEILCNPAKPRLLVQLQPPTSIPSFDPHSCTIEPQCLHHSP